MATRTTEPAVRKILTTKLTTPQVASFIADASLWVDEELVPFGTLTVARLEVIERWLAAALIRAREVGLARGSIEDVSETYQVDPQVTDYLLRAAAMDPTGTVRKHFLAGKPVAVPNRAPFDMVGRIGPGFVEEANEGT